MPVCLRAVVLASAVLAFATMRDAAADPAPATRATADWLYSLFNPVPESAMRSFNTDRPTKSNVPFTIDAGHFQYEMDLFNYARQVSGTTRTQTWIGPNPTLKA